MRPFKPEHYYRVSFERMRQAQFLYRDGSSFALSMYSAGVAAESMLRAFKAKRDTTFDEKHDLRKLFHASGILQPQAASLNRISDEGLSRFQREMQLAVEDIHLLWSNDYRFASEERLRSHLKKSQTLRRGIKGDILKVVALRLIDACQTIIHRGATLWPLW
jgi:hypothetical protein